MDKRTFIFLIALSITLFGVNLFFQWLNRGELEKWHQQQKVLLERQEKELTQQIEQKTAPASALPLVELFADDLSEDSITSGILAGETVLTLSWAPNLPKHIFYRPFGSQESTKKVEIAFAPETIGELTIYRLDPTAKVPLGNLPSFGNYDLQLIVPQIADPKNPFKIFFAEYEDGNLSIPYQQLISLHKQLKEQPQEREQINNAIAVIKADKTFLPVAIYAQDSRSLIPISHIAALSSQLLAPQVTEEMEETKQSEEKFYVLENDYQQLVFSNHGAALAEINLPFQSSTNPNSVVKEVQYDRDMVLDHPYNAMFPQHPYYTAGDLNVHPQGQLGGYYPLLRRNLIEPTTRQSIFVPPYYYALNFVSEYPEVSEIVFEVKSFTKDTIVFEAVQTHRRITKTYSIAQQSEGAPYCIDVTIKIVGDTRGLWISSGVPEVELISGSPAPSMKYRIVRSQNKSEILEISLPKDVTTVSTVNPNWIETSNSFFGIILDPLTKIASGYRTQYVSGTVVPSRLVEIDEEYDRFKAANMPGYMVMLPIKGSNGVFNFRIFAGPYASKILTTVDKTFTDPSTGYSPQYIGVQGFHGWFAFISEPFAKFLYILMKLFYQITGSWGFSIILLTIALRLMLYPLNAWSTRSMIKMQEVSPKMQAIQEKYKKDPRKAQLEIMNLYRETGANPLSGCFPILIQIPFLMGMFGLLKTTFSLRGASFIPGWIDDLSAPDVLFSWDRPIYFIGTEFHLLPIILGVVMFMQQRLMSKGPKDPNQMTEQQRQARAMGNIMAVVFALMFYHFPSGLNIYWLSSMLLGILQQWWTQKRLITKKADVVEAKVTKVSSKRK